MSEKVDKEYKKVAQVINSAGGTPFPVTDTLIEILKRLVEAKHLSFIRAFRKKKSQTMEQLKESSGLSEQEIEEKVKVLAKIGLIFNQPNSKGVMVFRLMPFVNVGIFEYMFMKELEDTPENRELAQLFGKLKDEGRERLTANYDALVSFLQKMPPIDRTIPYRKNKATGKEIVIDQEVEVGEQKILLAQTVEELVNKFDDIAVGHCFCRHHQDLMGNPCKQTNERENCFTFGKSARFTTEQGFARMVSKEEALKIFKKAEEDGLVHKAYHANFDLKRDETSICNCCTCCCGQAGGPSVNATNFIAQIDHDICVGCGTCVEHCHTNAMMMNDDGKAENNKDRCIGCGVCAYVCPENAITLVENQRKVVIAPTRPS